MGLIRRKHRIFGARIALLAMLLIYLGPLVTKAQVAHTSNTHSAHASAAEQMDHSYPLQHMSHGNCGYCVLLTKLPAMSPRGTAAFPRNAISEGNPSAPRLISAPQGLPGFPNAPVRAPPAMV
ncbi:DUF2946 domain-containing protein [Marinobacter nauticus]|uniref:DUF2946 domain-containing protein n=1 Tax=Marinobacter nauticus TaxID=2743 RepID=UPI001C55F83F|nr:DUF2946 domain-containing protein [Marinobacter nauticus]MBW3196307.1 DUF2946 domain-containing protein [Marinobacter nauticus]MBY6181717.1 DUF2946 domain-containing protein [Marinobacter nauticus]